MFSSMTRRHFLGTLTKGFVLLAGGCTLRTTRPVTGSEKGTVRLVFYTDVHARTEWETPVAMMRAARAMNERKPHLTIAGGDLITDGFQSSEKEIAPRWEAYMRMHRAIEGDLFPAMGNHDLVAVRPRDGSPPSEDPRAAFRDRMGLEKTYYSFDAVGYHFVMLDAIQVTGGDANYQGVIPPGQLEWFKEDLSRLRKGAPIVITTHIPLVTAFFQATRGGNFAPPKNRVIVNSLEVFKTIRGHNVVLVLQGHMHTKELHRWRETTFVVGGAISGKWWRGPWQGTEEGFNVITLSRDRIEWEYVDYGWEARRPRNK